MKCIEIKNPAFDYDNKGQFYSGIRRADKRIATHINEALGSAKTVLNIGAGAGSYEPDDRYVIAVEPSARMRSQRKSLDKIPAVIANADSLPFDDDSFDASIAILTIHHWPDINKGLKEIRRVTKDRIVIMTFDPDALNDFWNVHYFPELIEVERKRYPTIEFIKNSLGGKSEVRKIPVPYDCTDGFQEAFYGRPEEFLKKEVRQSQSAWGFLPEGLEESMIKALSDDLQSGEWDRKFGKHRSMTELTCALRIIVGSL